MRPRALLAALLLVAAGFIVAVTILPGVARAATLYVGGSGPGNYTTIGAAITAASTGDAVFVFSGTYPETVNIGKTISVIGENRDATIIDGGSLYLTAQWANVSGFTFRGRGGPWGIRAHFATDCRIEGNAISGYAAGIWFNSSTRITLTNNAFTGTGIYINGMNGGSYLVEHWDSHVIGTSNAVNGKPIVYWKDVAGGTIPPGAGQVLLANVSGVTVENQSLTNASVGVEVGFSTGVRVQTNTISGNVIDGVRLHYSTSSRVQSNAVSGNGEGIAVWVSDNTSVVNNTIGSNRVGGITITASQGAVVTNNTLSSNIGSGILVESGAVSFVGDNTVSGSTGGILSYGDRVTIVHNTLFGNVNGIDVGGATPTVVQNTVYANTGRGIMVELPGYAVVANNNVSGNAQGIQLYQTMNNTVFGNLVHNNRDGIFSGSGAAYNTIDNNTATQNDYGITLYLSTGDTIIRNNVTGNRLGGVTIGSSTFTVVQDNLVAANAFGGGTYGGIFLESTTGTRVFHNSVLGNARQARDDGTNLWDNGYPSGGNHWSDYTGVDNCSGPSQNVCPSPDGIGDTPYSIPVSDRDRYPLMASPVSQPTPPSAPSLVAVRGDRSVTLTWSAPIDDGGSPITNYRIFRSTTPGTEALLIELGRVLTYTDSGLSNGVRYYYQVSAKNAVGEGPRSPEARVTPATVPGPPSTLQATPGIQRITLTWAAPAGDGGAVVTSYRILRGTSPGGEVFLTSVGALTYLDTSVSSGTTYYYQVSAVNTVGESARSAEAHATPSSPANQPPACSVATPASGDHVSGTYPVTGSASDPDGSVVRVEVRIDSGSWANATGASSWRYDWNTRSVSDGSHTIHARSYDGTNYSGVVDINVTVDNGIPPPLTVFAEGWFWGLLGLVVLVSALLLFVLWRQRRKPRPPEAAS